MHRTMFFMLGCLVTCVVTSNCDARSAATSACRCDLDGSGFVDVDDLLIVLGAYGSGDAGDCTGDGETDVDDLLAVLGEWGAECATPGDEHDDPIVIVEGIHEFDTSRATVNDDDPAWSCAPAGGPDIWYCFEAECSTTMRISTCYAADFDTIIQVFETDGPGCDGALTEVACNDQGFECCGSMCEGFTSELLVEAVAGTHYLIRLGGANGDVGAGTLFVECPASVCNCTCDAGIALPIGECRMGSTAGAPIPILVQGDCDGFVPTWGGVWYEVIGDGTTLTVTTCAGGTSFDTVLVVVCGGCHQQFCVATNDDDPSCSANFVGESTVTFCTEPGEEYAVLVTGHGAGVFEICATSDGVPCAEPPACVFVCENTSGIANDCCEDRTPISDGVTVGIDTTGANTDGQADASCQFDGQTYHDVWFNYTASCDGLLTVSTCEIAQYDTDLVVYDGCGECYDFTLLGCNDDGADCAGFSSQTTVPVAAGNCYTIRLGGWNDGDQGVTDLDVSCEPLCTFECPSGAEQEQGPQACPVDGDDANLDPNGGCNSRPDAFGSITIGVPLCGQASTYVDISGGELRDTDWFVFDVPAGGQEMTLTCHAEFAALFGIVSDVDTCAAPAFVVSGGTDGNCDERSVTAFLAEGNYAAFCATVGFSGVPCSTGRNDYWLRVDEGGGPCTFECPAGASDENGPQQCPVDGDDSAADPNGGCNSVPASFGSIAMGETVCGQGSTYVDISGGQFRDTDWYLFAHAGGDATVTVNAEFAALFGIVSGVDGCAAPAFVVSGSTLGNCDEQSVTALGLGAGNYAVFVAPSVFDGVPCSIGLNDYWMRLD